MILDPSIISTPLQYGYRKNWIKFSGYLDQTTEVKIPPVNSIHDIYLAVAQLTANIQSAIDKSKFKINSSSSYRDCFPNEISHEIETKNFLRHEWQIYRNPATKWRLNKKITFIGLMLHTHRQDG